MQMNEVVVIGAGVTGLTRALALVKAGKTPLIIDPAAPGGLIKTVHQDGYTLECGANTFVDTPAVRAVLRAIGLESAMRFPVIPRFRQYIWHQGAPRAVPKSPLALLRSPLFPAGEKLRAASGIFKRYTPGPEGLTIHAVFTRIFSEHISRAVVSPVLRGIFGGDTEALLAPRVFPKLWRALAEGGNVFSYMRSLSSAGKRRIFAIEGGNQLLTTRLASVLEGQATLVRDAVVAISAREDGSFVLSCASGAEYATKEVVVSTAGAATAKFIGNLSPSLAAKLAAVRYAPVAVVHLALPAHERLPERGFGVLFPKEEDGAPMGVLFNSELFPHVAPAGKKLVTVCFGGVGSESKLEAT
ncbi:MAG: protoporphyrinogen oxidase, partial [Proteobacteria bacterium]|nr:protoporphyrinogen oxidase [Pseudomonadota bacterium]